MGFIDPKTDLGVLFKQPYEEIRLTMPCTPRMRDGDTVSNVDDVTVSNITNNGTGTVVAADQQTDGSSIQCTYSGGADKEDYKVTIKFTTTGGDKLEVDGLLKVREK